MSRLELRISLSALRFCRLAGFAESVLAVAEFGAIWILVPETPPQRPHFKRSDLI
jgi:hypothetical protein